jgi:hypothetical protein
VRTNFHAIDTLGEKIRGGPDRVLAEARPQWWRQVLAEVALAR